MLDSAVVDAEEQYTPTGWAAIWDDTLGQYYYIAKATGTTWLSATGLWGRQGQLKRKEQEKRHSFGIVHGYSVVQRSSRAD